MENIILNSYIILDSFSIWILINIEAGLANFNNRSIKVKF